MSEATWFITGSSRGFGRALAVAALEAGHRVAATARRPADLQELADTYGDAVLPVALDVTDPVAAEAAIAATVEAFGRVDVVVNNAGYANLGPIETTPPDDFRRQFETNFWGVYHVTRAALPVLRAQGEGTVVQFSSIGGRVGGSAGLGSYQAAKFAVDGFTRVLAAETAPLGIRTLVVEPGGFATDWAGSSMTIHDVPPAYDGTVGVRSRAMDDPRMTAGDPARAAEILVSVVGREHVPGHLVLGAGAADMALARSRAELAEAETWHEVSRSADFAQPYPAQLPPDAG